MTSSAVRRRDVAVIEPRNVTGRRGRAYGPLADRGGSRGRVDARDPGAGRQAPDGPRGRRASGWPSAAARQRRLELAAHLRQRVLDPQRRARRSPCARRSRAPRAPSCARTAAGPTAPGRPGRSPRSAADRPSARAGSPRSSVGRPAQPPRGRAGNSRSAPWWRRRRDRHRPMRCGRRSPECHSGAPIASGELTLPEAPAMPRWSRRPAPRRRR